VATSRDFIQDIETGEISKYKDRPIVTYCTCGIRCEILSVLMRHRGMMTYRDAKTFLRNMINLPRELVHEDMLFWKMQERLSHHDFSKQQHELFMKPVSPIISRAFAELGYENPESETQLLLLIIEGLWKKNATGDLQNIEEITHVLEKRYGL